MSTSNIEETEELIIKLLKKIERKGKNIQALLWKLMDQFEDESFDEKNEENTLHLNNKITLLYNPTAPYICKIGHTIRSAEQKHLSNDPCIICGHRNNNNTYGNTNDNQVLQFLNNYNTNQMQFGPHQQQKTVFKAWTTKGLDKKWPLHYAAITGDTVKINELLKNKNINVEQKRIDWNDKTPITCAAWYGQLESVVELMKHGADPMLPPDKGNGTPYKMAVYWKHNSIIVFFREYVKYLHGFDITNKANLECYKCYSYDLHFNKHMLNGTMSNYVYCQSCSSANVKKVKKKQTDNLIIERRIIKTIKENPSISVDTLCQMKDVKSLHSILKEIMVSGQTHAYWLWLVDIDNFKAINTHLTHAVADTKIQELAQVLKQFEPITVPQWTRSGYDGMNKVWAFRQGGDEFALVVYCNNQKKKVLQKLYERLRNAVHNIKLENMVMKHITISVGVCHGQAIVNYEEMMKKADEAVEMVKKNGKNDLAIYHPFRKRTYKTFTEI